MNTFHKNSIIFTTAFRDIGRKNWVNYKRSNEEYIKNFLLLAQNIVYKLIVYLEDDMLEIISKFNLKSNVIFYKLSEVDTFYDEFLENEKKMLNSDEYKSKLADFRRTNPEHWSAEYNLINHSKINFVSHTKKLYPMYEYYAWIDFGCIRDKIDDIPKNINFKKLHKKISYLALKELPKDKVSADTMLKVDDIYLAGSQFITHNSLVEQQEYLYRDLLQSWKKEIICDDDQNAILQIYYNNKDLFELFYTPEWFSLFRNHLNSNIEVNNRYDIHKLINSSDFSGSYVEIGVAKGVFTKYICENTSLSKLMLVDPYKNFDTKDFLDSMNYLEMESLLNSCKNNLFNYRHRVKFIRKTSTDAISEIDDNSVDVVYIDGNHAYTFVLDDLKNYWPKLRSGGIMFGDDVYEYSENKDVVKIWDGVSLEKSNSWGVYGVHAADIDFCKENKLHYNIFSNQFMIYKP